MREIKFRAWNSNNNEMLSDDYLKVEGYHLSDFDSTGGMIFMQFTGLKDKNGKDIYEGDICVYTDSKENKKGFVRFDGGRFEIGKHNGYGGDWDDLGMLLHNYWNNKEAQNSFKVIGNIYENKELLENEDE